MGFMTQLFGGGKVAATQSAVELAPPTFNKAPILRTAPQVEAPRYFTEGEASSLKALSKEKTEGARHSIRAYKRLTEIEEADTKVHRAHRRYQVAVADNALARAKSDARLERKLHQIRPDYERLNQGINQARIKADQRIADLKSRMS